MSSALEELAYLERLKDADKTPKGKLSPRFVESQRAARARAAIMIESLVEDLGDKAAPTTVLKMVEAAGAELDRPLKEAARRGDQKTALVLTKFMERIRNAVAEAAEETLAELRR